MKKIIEVSPELKLDSKTNKIASIVILSRFIGVILIIYGFFKWIWSFFKSDSGLLLFFFGIILIIILFPLTLTKEYKSYIKKKEEHKQKVNEEFEVQTQMNKIEDRLKKRQIREEAERRLYGNIKTKRVPLNEEEKEMIFDKFENQCVTCGRKEGLHIHHKDKNSLNNKLDNLIILCGICHKKIHMNIR